MNKIKYLEGLRGVCCFIVILDHCINEFKPDIRFTGLTEFGGLLRKLVALTPINIIYSGIAPVCIFFILSGFVLSIKFNRTGDYKDITAGVIKRYPRLIFPILGAMIFMYIAFKLLALFTGHNMGLHFLNALSEALYYAPFEHVQLKNYALWTISFEIYGSLIVFCMLALFGKHQYKMFFYVITFMFLFYNSSFYCLFVIGMIFSDLYTKECFKISSVMRFIMFIAGLFFVTSPYQREGVDVYGGMYFYLKLFDVSKYTDIYQVMMLIGSILIFSSILNSELSVKILSSKVTQFLGRVSFPLYIIHATILSIISYLLHSYFNEITMQVFLLVVLVTIPFCLIISSLFERYVDVPSIKLANILANKFN
ncbi:acyltransferase family protein [Pantoea agglomerans]